MSSLGIYFSNGKCPELLRTTFKHRLLESELACIRGKTSGAYRGYGTFQWTSAVHALCIFLVKSKCDSEAILSGGFSTPASSLDYALSKEPNWLAEMFGYDRDGSALAKKFIWRSNSNHKRSGETSLSLNQNQLAPEDISIYIGNKLVSDEIDLDELLKSLEVRWQPHHNNKRVSVVESNEQSPKSSPLKSDLDLKLTEFFEEELFFTLKNTNIFSTKALRKNVRQALEHKSFRQIAGKGAQKLANLDSNLHGSERFGLFHDDNLIKRELCRDKPIRVAIPALASGAQILFRYLQEIKGYNIEILFKYTHAVEIVKKMKNGDFVEPPDLSVLGTPPLARLLSCQEGSDFHPLMFMPYCSQRIVTSKQNQGPLNHGRYMFINDDPSHPSFFFDDLERTGEVKNSAVDIEHAEPDDTLLALAEGDPDLKAILFFPYYTVNTQFNNCVELSNPLSHHSLHELVLVGHSKFTQNIRQTQLIQIALRDAWLTLLEKPELAKRLNREALEVEERMTFLKRVSGLSYLEQAA